MNAMECDCFDMFADWCPTLDDIGLMHPSLRYSAVKREFVFLFWIPVILGSSLQVPFADTS